VSPVLLAFLIGLTLGLLATSGALLVVNVATTEPLAEPTQLGRVALGVFASAALPIAVMLVGAL
jgi:hypothetical protein